MTKSLQFHPYMWPATIPLLEAKFSCLPHHDDIILMTSLFFKNYTFAPKGKIFLQEFGSISLISHSKSAPPLLYL